jgi:NAD(P)-dependent dehydrogenase (short-subunit alcohol dehydrogenase family)
MADLGGRAAIVTGGSKGIGRAIARALAGAGCDVTIAARTAADVQRAAAELGQMGPGKVRGQSADVGRYDDCRRLVTDAVAAFGRLDILVNNAGIGIFGQVAEMSPEDWDRTIATNLNGLFYCSHEALPHLRQAGTSWIINIGSLAGKNAFPGGAAYNASKFGVIGFSEALMQEVRYEGVRVSYVMPGSVATDFGQGKEEDWKIQPEDIAQIVLDLLTFPERTLPSRVEVRPSRPPRRG